MRPWQDHAGSVENAFRHGCAVVLGWCDAHTAIQDSLRTVGRHLAAIPAETSFPGMDGRAADRQSLWAAATGIGAELCTDPGGIAHLDGDADGGARGLAMLRSDPRAATAFRLLKKELDGALLAVLGNLGLLDGLPAACLSAMTVRYRASRYAPSSREQAGIGIHPDGNLISALITDQPGLVVLGGPGRVEWPEPADGTVVMPGTVLTRWSDGALAPTVHAVTVRRSDPVKCSVAAFLNFADGTQIDRRD
ncbi:MAG TPA: 2OG-Fe(II) oxygenase family protein, partial [Actinoplanes sp.]|nr:2OG-Fe(II) oxygenase family protein [Actinoplanes sp.]